MADDRIREEIITKFFLSTCQLRRVCLKREDAMALRVSAGIAGHANVEGNFIPLTTGSVAEFYIEPMLACFGDVDVMYHNSSELAIPAGCPPPAQLPGEFGSCVHVYEIVDSEFPGYVYVWSSYLLKESIDDGQYNAVQCERYLAMRVKVSGDVQMHGPAIVSESTSASLAREPSISRPHFDTSSISVDRIYCMHCLMWPPQAADWPIRQRNYGWPDTATVDRVVRNGSDVVQVAHHLCRHDEWMSKLQWRLSFSRAEIVLLNSWMPVQQIVYHMLRVFVKAEQLTDGAADNRGSGTLSNYHIKTLMLWACERKSGSWWTDDLNLVRICVKLLHTLAVWLTDAHCQHYFINNCNLFELFENSRYTQETANRLTLITRAWFSKWYISRYLHKCAPSIVSSLLCNPSRNPHELLHPITYSVSCLQNVAKWKMDTSLPLSFFHFSLIQSLIIVSVTHNSLTPHTCMCWMTELAKSDKILHLFFTAIVFLHIAHRITKTLLTDEVLDVLATTCLQSNNVRHCLNARHSSVLSLSRATILMKNIANNSAHNTVQLTEIELSKAYLHRALRCKDSNSDSIYCLTNVYLAVLYYTTGQYQTAMDHYTLVTRLQDHSHCSSHVVQGRLLPRVDNQVDNSSGLAVFYQYIRAAALNVEQERRHAGVFTTELFAHYFHIKFLSVTKCHQLSQASLTNEVQRYRNRFFHATVIYTTDVILFVLAYHNKYLSNDRLVMVDRDETKSTICQHLNTSKLVELLQQSAVEYLTICRELEVQNFASLHVVTTDFKALYAYKCGHYQRCLQLSANKVSTLTADRCHYLHYL